MAKRTKRPAGGAERAAKAFADAAEARVTDAERDTAKGRIAAERASGAHDRLRHLEAMQARLQPLQGVTDRRITRLAHQYAQHVAAMFADLIDSNGAYWEIRDHELAESLWEKIDNLRADRERRSRAAKGGKVGSTARKTTAAEWQKKIEREVKRWLSTRTNANIAALLAPKTATGERAARTPGVVSRYVARLRKAAQKNSLR